MPCHRCYESVGWLSPYPFSAKQDQNIKLSFMFADDTPKSLKQLYTVAWILLYKITLFDEWWLQLISPIHKKKKFFTKSFGKISPKLRNSNLLIHQYANAAVLTRAQIHLSNSRGLSWSFASFLYKNLFPPPCWTIMGSLFCAPSQSCVNGLFLNPTRALILRVFKQTNLHFVFVLFPSPRKKTKKHYKRCNLA